MRSKIEWLGTISLMALLAWAPGCKSKDDAKPAADVDVAPTVETIEEDAVAIVKRAVHYLRDADSFHVAMEIGFDVVQSDGQKIEFGSTRAATIQRPNRAHFEFEQRDGKDGVIVFDGNDIWAYSPTHNVYAHTPQPGGIDESTALVTEDLGITSPMAELFATEAGSTLADGLRSCYVVGDSTVGGVVCDHVAIRNEYADYQMWIAQGDKPVLQRIVISYREEEGEPQFWATFTEWNMAPNADSRTFVFQPPTNAEKILFNSIRPQGEE